MSLQVATTRFAYDPEPVWTLRDQQPVTTLQEKDNWFMRRITKDIVDGAPPTIIIGGPRRLGKTWMSLKIAQEIVDRCHMVKYAYRDRGMPTEIRYDLRKAQFDVTKQLLFSLRTIPDLLQPPPPLETGLPYGSVIISDESSVNLNALSFNSPIVKRVSELHDTCVKGDTIILGDNKPISEYEAGNQHFGLNGLGTVNKVFKREYSGEMIRIKGHGMLPFEVTPEHPILTMRYTRPNECEWISGTNWHKTLEYRPAKDLLPKRKVAGKWYNQYHTYDCLVLPIPRKNTFVRKYLELRPFTSEVGYKRAVALGLPPRFPLNVDTAWLLGLYVAEGCSHVTGAIFNLGAHEMEIQRKVIKIIQGLGLTPYVDPHPAKGSAVIWIKSAVIARAFKMWCGNHADHKQVPESILFHRNLKIVQAFLNGYVDGDSCLTNRGTYSYYTASTVSRTLALQLQLLAMKLGLFATISLNRKAGIGYIQGRQVNLRDRYMVQIRKAPYTCRYVNTFGYSNQHKWHDILAVPIEEMSKTTYTGPVYNLETSDNTYLVNNAVVHNCGFRLISWVMNVPGSVARVAYQLRETASYFMQMKARGVAKVYEARPWVTGRVGLKTIGWLGYMNPFTKRVLARIGPPKTETLRAYYVMKDFWFKRLLARSEQRMAALAAEGWLGPYDTPEDYKNDTASIATITAMKQKHHGKHEIPNQALDVGDVDEDELQ